MATLIPHLYPDLPPGWPPFSIGARLPRTRRRARRSGSRPTGSWRWGSSRAAASTTTAARGSGLPPLPYVHTGLSRSLTMVGTFPQLEYPRAWEPWQRVVGPMLWEPGGPRVVAAAGRRAGRARRDLDLAGPVAPAARRVPGGTGGRARARDRDLRRRARRRRTPCSSRGCRTPRRCRSAISSITHGGHGTLARALACGVPVLVCPAGRRHGRERRPRRLGGRRRAARTALLHAVGRAAGGPAGVARPVAARAGGRARPLGGRASRAGDRRDPAGTLGRDGEAYAGFSGGVSRTWTVPVSPGWPPGAGVGVADPEDRAQVRRAGVAGVQRRRDRARAARGRGLRVAVLLVTEHVGHDDLVAVDRLIVGDRDRVGDGVAEVERIARLR